MPQYSRPHACSRSGLLVVVRLVSLNLEIKENTFGEAKRSSVETFTQGHEIEVKYWRILKIILKLLPYFAARSKFNTIHLIKPVAEYGSRVVP